MMNNISFYFILLSILIFAFLPHEFIPNIVDEIDTKYTHVFAFFTVSLYMYYFRKIDILQVLFFTLIFGIFIEVFQGLFTSRDFSIYDIVYDMLGFVVFLVFQNTHAVIFNKPHGNT